jgi:hypothetical protein
MARMLATKAALSRLRFVSMLWETLMASLSLKQPPSESDEDKGLKLLERFEKLFQE